MYIELDSKEILTGLEVIMQFCCPEEWEYSTRRSRVEYSHYEGQQNCIFTENGPVNISIIIFYILKKVNNYFYILLMLLPLDL